MPRGFRPVGHLEVLRGGNAACAVEHGVRAVVVTAHGSRQLGAAVRSIDVLPEMADRVGGRAGVHLNGGVCRRTDVIKALAFRARVAFVDRPVVYGLAVGGADEVTAQRVVDRMAPTPYDQK